MQKEFDDGPRTNGHSACHTKQCNEGERMLFYRGGSESPATLREREEKEEKNCDLHSISGLMYPLQSTVELSLSLYCWNRIKKLSLLQCAPSHLLRINFNFHSLVRCSRDHTHSHLYCVECRGKNQPRATN